MPDIFFFESQKETAGRADSLTASTSPLVISIKKTSASGFTLTGADVIVTRCFYWLQIADLRP